MAWLLSEDEALKVKLSGIMLRDSQTHTVGRKVPVRFRYPEPEVAPRNTEINYPLIVIEHLGLTRNNEIEHRGFIPIFYTPEGYDELPEDEQYWGDFPIPFNIDYAITTYTRRARQDRELTGMLAQFERIPHRFGFLVIPQDNTIRRLDLMEGPTPLDAIDDGKRIFRQRYVVRVASELIMAPLVRAAKVMNIDLSVLFAEYPATPTPVP